MTLDTKKLLDETNWQLLEALQRNARLSYSELGQQVGLTAPAVAERIRKMEEQGIIRGYHAEVDLALLGLPIVALVRLVPAAGLHCRSLASAASELPEVLECYRMAGNDQVLVKVAATSIAHLDSVLDQLAVHGQPSTSITFSQPTMHPVVTHELLGQERKNMSTSSSRALLMDE
ncbi:Lrp/AsnC family transcriptional regulator [Ktedonospora formicarum]|uniref:AsnC family transcriptional regulator n=1 Tax=Ktedonospora formicarum TaxID=2778364 RepID=A0A8J3I7R4_9CHLR|nr:Lrp/AsnC family transcriptional regulator [Ktedonospora formicarum]GHO46939.1 AsnC family transcriptional regulator [Ktedonospora formicarum]